MAPSAGTTSALLLLFAVSTSAAALERAEYAEPKVRPRSANLQVRPMQGLQKRQGVSVSVGSGDASSPAAGTGGEATVVTTPVTVVTTSVSTPIPASSTPAASYTPPATSGGGGGGATTILPTSARPTGTVTSTAAAITATSTAAPVVTVVPATSTVRTAVQTVVPSQSVIETVNAQGQVITLTSTFAVTQVTSIETVSVGSRTTTAAGGAAALNDASSTGSSFFNNTGAVVGTFLVVGLAAAAILLGLVFFCIRRRRRKALDEDVRVAAGGAGDGGAGTSRFRDDDDDLGDGSDHTHPTFTSAPHMAQYSDEYYGSAGVGAAAAVAYSDPFGDHRRHSQASMTSAGVVNGRARPASSSYGLPSDQQHFSAYGGGSAGPDHYSDWNQYQAAYGAMGPVDASSNSHYEAMPAGAAVAGQHESGSSTDHSDPVPVDQRMNPRAVLDRMHMQQQHANHSETSLDDNNDYSRPLRVANPE